MAASVNTKFRSDISAEMTKLVAPAITKFVTECHGKHQAKKFFSMLPHRTIAKIACRVSLNGMLNERPQIEVAFAIGSELGLAYEKQSQLDGDAWDIRRKQLSNACGWYKTVWQNHLAAGWCHIVKLRMGLILLAFIRDATGMFKLERDCSKAVNQPLCVVPTDQLLDWMKTMNVAYESDQFRWIPTAEPQPQWSDETPRIIRNNKGPKGGLTGIPRVHAALNKVQGVPWRVNEKIAKVFTTAWEQGWAVAGLAAGEQPTEEGWVTKREWAARKEAIFEWGKIRRRTAQIAYLLTLLRERKRFFYPWHIDFRGRMYPGGAHITPQGHDLGRSLIEFDEGRPIGSAAVYLAHHGANHWGIKGSYKKREAWVREKFRMIQRCAKDPFTYQQWTKAAEPWKFLAFCFEWEGFLRDGPDHITHMPCQIDGTCNGFQIVSMLMKDENLAKLVNVVDSEIPNDFYTQIGERVYKRCVQQQYPGHEWLSLMHGKIDRAVVKAAVISIGFGSNAWVVRKSVINWFWRMSFAYPFKGTVASPCHWLSQQIGNSLKEETQSFDLLAKWCRKVASIAMESRDRLRWTSPVGMKIECYYPKVKKLRMEVHLPDGSLQEIKCQELLPEPAKKLTTSRVVPNFIHSLDAAGLMAAIERCDFHVSAIHDCLGALAPDMSRLHQAVRDGYSEVFSQDVLGDWAEEVCGQRVELPKQGTLDLSQIKHARYLFT